MEFNLFDVINHWGNIFNIHLKLIFWRSGRDKKIYKKLFRSIIYIFQPWTSKRILRALLIVKDKYIRIYVRHGILLKCQVDGTSDFGSCIELIDNDQWLLCWTNYTSKKNKIYIRSNIVLRGYEIYSGGWCVYPLRNMMDEIIAHVRRWNIKSHNTNNSVVWSFWDHLVIPRIVIVFINS